MWHCKFIYTRFHKSDAEALKDRSGVVSENTFWWALKVLARKWSLWTSPERAGWMPNQRRASKTRNRPGIRDKHLRARGHRQHQLSHEDNGPLIRTMIAPARFSLSTWQLKLPTPIILINPVIFPKPALYRPLMRNLIRSRQKQAIWAGTGVMFYLSPSLFTRHPFRMFLHFHQNVFWPSISIRAAAVVLV